MLVGKPKRIGVLQDDHRVKAPTFLCQQDDSAGPEDGFGVGSYRESHQEQPKTNQEHNQEPKIQ